MIIPCVSKPGCTHRIIVSLWLICYILCGFSMSYLSIFGIVGHDRYNISQIFLFSFNVQCRPVPLIYITVFQKDSKRRSVLGSGWVGVLGHNYLFQDFGLFNFIQCLWNSFLLVHTEIYYHYYYYLHFHYYHYCYGHYFLYTQLI